NDRDHNQRRYPNDIANSNGRPHRHRQPNTTTDNGVAADSAAADSDGRPDHDARARQHAHDLRAGNDVYDGRGRHR
ncbi:MAG: hypothetical protein IAE79_19375, partial [Anaerolinea sp.]|nr:hypothetical protein [Anaerolinea sp.]